MISVISYTMHVLKYLSNVQHSSAQPEVYKHVCSYPGHSREIHPKAIESPMWRLKAALFLIRNLA